MKKESLKHILKLLKPYSFTFTVSLILSLISVGITLYIPILVGHAIDSIVSVNNVDFDVVIKNIIYIAVLVVICAVLQWIISYLNNRMTFNVIRDVRIKAFNKMQVLPLSFLDRKPTGDIINRIVSDVDTFADGLLLGFSQFFTGIMTILGTMIFMFMLDYRIALAVVVITPLSLFIARYISRHTYDMFKTQSVFRAEQTSLIEETITNQKVVKAFAQEENRLNKYDEIDKKLKKASVRAIFLSSLVNPSTRFVNALVYAAVGGFGALSVIGTVGGNMTVGLLTSFLSYANQYTKPFNEISGVITELQNAFACFDRVYEFINEKEETEDKTAGMGKAAEGNVELDNVYFSYNPQKPLIEDFNLNVKCGMRVAIVGPTGCGKTTLINLLMRFYDVRSGSISVDECDIRNITRKSLRKNYGMVLQDTWLKSGTVRENIAFGKPDATLDEIIAAAKASYAHGFIKRLPYGYDTPITSGGENLSAGQRQLLCIARVMLSLPPMLILDEATSSIDTRTELKIQNAFEKMMQGRTSFIVAHRLSTVVKADVILVMRDGRIVESGTHKELLAKNGFYASIYNSQFQN